MWSGPANSCTVGYPRRFAPRRPLTGNVGPLYEGHSANRCCSPSQDRAL